MSNYLKRDSRTDTDATRRFLDQLEDAMPMPLEGLKVKGAGVYAFYLVSDRSGMYPNAVANEHPMYVGATANLGARMGEYRRRIRKAAGIDLSAVRVRIVPHSVHRARYAESLLHACGPYPWNQGGPIAGLGSNAAGGGRAGSCRPAWHVVHPGWPAAKKLPARYSKRKLRRRARAFDAKFAGPTRP